MGCLSLNTMQNMNCGNQDRINLPFENETCDTEIDKQERFKFTNFLISIPKFLIFPSLKSFSDRNRNFKTFFRKSYFKPSQSVNLLPFRDFFQPKKREVIFQQRSFSLLILEAIKIWKKERKSHLNIRAKRGGGGTILHKGFGCQKGRNLNY